MLWCGSIISRDEYLLLWLFVYIVDCVHLLVSLYLVVENPAGWNLAHVVLTKVVLARIHLS
jgi:hypothetical protein